MDNSRIKKYDKRTTDICKERLGKPAITSDASWSRDTFPFNFRKLGGI
jgi:hypothetical protein